ncbi:PKD domain-containing protein [uncultured Maribacter sp.]|uniref:PKD domain-containing protein n=1 Tax=uncultured Maribacter sp. TaxID=431308 RepID=UPI00261D402D|nr:PKD domain-containing protein [uncultured Maribacter sp.]
MKNKTDQTPYLDNMVRYFFAAIIVISLTIVGFKVASSMDCEYVEIDISAMDYRVGELIEFTDLTEKGEKWVWSFGDSTDTVDKRKAYHIYDEPGTYEIRLMVNGQCERLEEITIKEKKFVLDPSKVPNFELPESIAVGEKLRVKDTVNKSYSWEWRFGDTSEANSTDKKAEYTYKEPGIRTVSLITNGDIRHMASKKITVYLKDNPPPTPSRRRRRTNNPAVILDTIPIIPDNWIENQLKKDMGPYISEDDFKMQLEKVVKEDASPKLFAKYFCGEINKNCIVDGESMPFLQLCTYLKKRKRRKITKLELFREEGSNCIKYVQLSLKRKWLQVKK